MRTAFLRTSAVRRRPALGRLRYPDPFARVGRTDGGRRSAEMLRDPHHRQRVARAVREQRVRQCLFARGRRVRADHLEVDGLHHVAALHGVEVRIVEVGRDRRQHLLDRPRAHHRRVVVVLAREGQEVEDALGHVAQRGRKVRERVRELQKHGALERRVVDDERAAVADRRDERLGERAARIVACPCRGRAAVRPACRRRPAAGTTTASGSSGRGACPSTAARPDPRSRSRRSSAATGARRASRWPPGRVRPRRCVSRARSAGGRRGSGGRPARRASLRILRCATGARACRRWAAGRPDTARSPARRTRGTRTRTDRCTAARWRCPASGPARSRCAAAIHSGICSCSGTTASVRSANAKRPR